MRLLMHCHNPVLLVLALGCSPLSVQADKIDFSAILMTGTCTFNLDKSMLALGTTTISDLQPATLVRAQAFTLSVSDCTGTDLNLTPVINISGDGITQDNRWLFRASDSTTNNKMGVMLVKSDVLPNYNAVEIKNNDDIVLADKGINPLDQNFTFYAAMSCGTTGCSSLQAGTLSARVLFQLAYR